MTELPSAVPATSASTSATTAETTAMRPRRHSLAELRRSASRTESKCRLLASRNSVSTGPSSSLRPGALRKESNSGSRSTGRRVSSSLPLSSQSCAARRRCSLVVRSARLSSIHDASLGQCTNSASWLIWTPDSVAVRILASTNFFTTASRSPEFPPRLSGFLLTCSPERTMRLRKRVLARDCSSGSSCA